MEKIRISIITPSYNQGHFVEETIQSVLNQHYHNFEHIIVDGGSTDNTINILKKYPHLIWVSEPDKGQSNAINKGFKMASGDIVCWINSDDILLPSTLKVVSNYFNKNPDIEFLNGNTLRIDAYSNILFNNHIIKPKKWFARRGIFNIAQQSMFWRKEVFNKIGYLDESFHAEMDLEFLIRIFEFNIKIGFLDYSLGAIRIHENTKTAIGGEIWENDQKKIKQKYNGQYDCTNISKTIFFLFVMLKFIKLKYLKDFLFKLRWQGKAVFLYHTKPPCNT